MTWIPSPASQSGSSDGLLVFDVGANVGVKAAMFVARGVRVVCFEPVPECLEALRARFDGHPSVTIVPDALGAETGTLPISICSEATTISTFSGSWKEGRFKNSTWDHTFEVRLSTLDAAIAAYGRPDFARIDVAGFELPVLGGLSQTIPVLSFEFCVEGLKQTSACLDRLTGLGYRRFNVVYGECGVMRHHLWVGAAELIDELRKHPSRLVWGDVYAASEDAPSRVLAALIPSTPQNDDTPPPPTDTLSELLWRGLAYLSTPLRLHLGSGEQHLPDYVNIDYPAEHHNVMKVRPDFAADITTLVFPPHSVDEVRLHHVFEHFNRVVALGLLIRWHGWLKPGGRLLIETPDFEGEACAFLKDLSDPHEPLSGPTSFSDRMSAIRSLEGDQTAAWGYHVGHWFAERFELTLSRLGFESILIQRSLSGHVPPLHNITVTAVRGPDRTEDEQVEEAQLLMWNSTVAEAERPTWEQWCRQLKRFLKTKGLPNLPVPHNALSEVAARESSPEAPPTSGKIRHGRPRAIVVRMAGGIGNQLFQYAAARAASLRLGTDLLLDIRGLQSDRLRSYYLSEFKISGRIISDEIEVDADLRRYEERSYHYDEAFESIGPGTLLIGYFQSERYFSDYGGRIRADIEPSAPPSAGFDVWAAAIRSSALPVSVHVRRGDFVSNPQTAEFHGICSGKYYRRALDVIGGLVSAAPDYFVFSDDRSEARELFGFRPDITLVETDLGRPWEDLILMSLCRHHVMANSSFSWWGAWRDRSVDKIVVAPRYWVAPRTLRQLNTADLYPEGTIIIS